MINPDLDFRRLAAQFRRHRRVQIHDFLAPDVAAKIEQTLLNEIEWSLALCLDGEDRLFSRDEWAGMAEAERRGLIARANESGRRGFQYVFEYYPMRAAFHEAWDPPSALNDVVAWIESDAFLQAVREVCGDRTVVAADCQATCYRTGHYLNQHDDMQHASRRLAYVLNLTRAWRTDWGGLLLFFDAAGNVAEGYAPAFNVLNLFAVPVVHAVSFVSPLAGAQRLAITGWLHDQPAPQ